MRTARVIIPKKQSKSNRSNATKIDPKDAAKNDNQTFKVISNSATWADGIKETGIFGKIADMLVIRITEARHNGKAVTIEKQNAVLRSPLTFSTCWRLR
jgi:hypothetical protein